MTNQILEAFYSLGRNINKARGKSADVENDEGIVSEKFPELELDMKNSELIDLTMKWQKTWTTSVVYSEWQKHGEENEAYWLGNQHVKPKVEKTRPTIDNVIFEALETYLPEATRRNPDPTAALAQGQQDTPENQKFKSELQKKLSETADTLKLRLKLKKAARHWAIYLLGIAKLGWDMDKDIPTVKIVRAKKLILDPEATVDEDGYTGNYIGEYRKLGASMLISMLKKIGAEDGAVKFIEDMVKDDLGTEVQFIEWWTPEYMCWTCNKQVLMKKKNPHWNYEQQVDAPMDENGNPQLDENGQPQTVGKAQPNHFKSPKMPYVFLSVFNLGRQPVDDTSLIGQNISTQDRINKRGRQIDKNADSMNNGMVVSLERSGLTAPQAKNVTKALRDGGTIAIPTGNVNEAMSRMSAPALPPDIYRDLVDQRGRVSAIFGSQGISPYSIQEDKTVRGKVLQHNAASDRIGGGVSEYLEQFADDIYNWFVQLLYVYDDFYATNEVERPEIVIGVKEGSMLPKDSASLAVQAIELAKAGKLSLLDLYKALDYPNPDEMASNLWLEVNAPEILYSKDPRIQQVMQMKQQAAADGEKKPPSTSISFKDLPPEGQAQLAAQAGINLHPEAIAAHDEMVAQRSKPPVPQPGEESIDQPIQ